MQEVGIKYKAERPTHVEHSDDLVRVSATCLVLFIFGLIIVYLVKDPISVLLLISS